MAFEGITSTINFLSNSRRPARTQQQANVFNPLTVGALVSLTAVVGVGITCYGKAECNEARMPFCAIPFSLAVLHYASKRWLCASRQQPQVESGQTNLTGQTQETRIEGASGFIQVNRGPESLCTPQAMEPMEIIVPRTPFSSPSR